MPASFTFDRGYTGHEHLDVFALVNMNGRIYDPATAHFLSPDNYVQNPNSTQNYNRYGYCLNNPLKYTDPSGEKWWHLAIADILTGGLVSSMAATLPFSPDPVSSAITAWGAGYIDGGFAEADRRAVNSWKITGGMFLADDEYGGSV